MTLSDFLAASQGDERLAWARFLFWNAEKPKYGDALDWLSNPCWMLESIHGTTNYLAMADSVLAELARQREEAWQGGYEQGRDSER